MTDLTSLLDSLLQKHSSHLPPSPRKRSDTRDEFLKEAYRINAHTSSLRTYLLSIRAPYLSTNPPPRPPPPNSRSHNHDPPPLYLDTPSRDAIDASSKTILRDLNASIRQLAEVESLRRQTETRVLEARFAKGVLGRWAQGGGAGRGGQGKSEEWVREEARVEGVGKVREGVLWYLGRGLEGVGEVQRGMMERRLRREVERGRSVLHKVRGGEGGGAYTGGDAALVAPGEEESRREIEQLLSPEQLQLFARENQDMLKQYEDTLDQVRTAERSMLEISELQTTLVQNLDVQSANISQLVADSLSTTENVGGGNKELKRASERKSTARMVFWASCGLCGFLVTWDLIF